MNENEGAVPCGDSCTECGRTLTIHTECPRPMYCPGEGPRINIEKAKRYSCANCRKMFFSDRSTEEIKAFGKTLCVQCKRKRHRNGLDIIASILADDYLRSKGIEP